MPKRGAGAQLTKDNQDDDSDGEVPTEQAVASEEKLAQRKIVKVKRKLTTGDSGAPAGAKFSFADAASDSKKPAAAAASAAAAAAPAAAAAAAPAKTGFAAHFGAGMWECPDCMLQNKKEMAKCPACTCPNPNMPQEPKGKSAAEQAVADAGISFGGGDSAPAAAPAAAAAAGESIFGTNVAGFGADGGFAFGGGASFGDMSSTDSSALTKTNPDFAAATTTPSEAPNPAAEQFKGKKAESSGEEKDTTVYTTKCKVYLLKTVKKNVKESALPKDDDDTSADKEGDKASNGAKPAAAAAAAAGGDDETEQKYVEIGSGDLKINKFTKDDGSAGARMVLRAEKVQRLVVNAPIFDGMSYAIQNEKYVRFISLGLASDAEPAKLQAHLLRFKSKAEASDVHKHMTDLIAATKGKK